MSSYIIGIGAGVLLFNVVYINMLMWERSPYVANATTEMERKARNRGALRKEEDKTHSLSIQSVL